MMSNALHLNIYKLKKGVAVSDFLLAAEKLCNEEIAKKKGYISFKLMVDGETWVDVVTFETMEDLQAFEEASHHPSELAKNFYSFINFTAKGNKHHQLSVERSYE